MKPTSKATAPDGALAARLKQTREYYKARWGGKSYALMIEDHEFDEIIAALEASARQKDELVAKVEDIPVLLMFAVQPSGRLLFCAFNKDDEQIGSLQAGDWSITKGSIKSDGGFLEIRRPFPTEVLAALTAKEGETAE